jgi:hypothetical protein
MSKRKRASSNAAVPVGIALARQLQLRSGIPNATTNHGERK